MILFLGDLGSSHLGTKDEATNETPQELLATPALPSNISSMKPAVNSAIALCIALLIAGCSGSGSRYDYDEPLDDYSPSGEYYDPQDFEPDYYDIPPPEPVQSAWSCYYDETYNYDWHDDVLCSDGIAYDRPYLLPDWGYVTYDDIMAAAAEYEYELNYGGH